MRSQKPFPELFLQRGPGRFFLQPLQLCYEKLSFTPYMLYQQREIPGKQAAFEHLFENFSFETTGPWFL